MTNDVLEIYTDGGSRGNPGKSACAFAAFINKTLIKENSLYLGITTNNVAEYQGVYFALKWIADSGEVNEIREVIFFLDSELIVKQLNGLYKIKNTNLLKINIDIKNLIKETNKNILFRNIPREQNKIADGLVNRELDKH